ncbi:MULTISPECIES: TipJ family phage tail tip protein [unclassified Marinovum]|uniref:TipJ family phage tail tip protein n=1 Tax=unclassified Marinovum TaxID=2647166 RepID=UPI003F599C1F
MTDQSKIPVLAAPMFDPGNGRIDLEVPDGLTISEILTMAMPGLPEAARRRVRVTLVTDHGVQVVPRSLWHVARPRPGVRVVLRVVPSDGAMKSILQIVIAVAAVALAAYFAPLLAGTIGLTEAAWTGLIMLGTTAVGNLLVSSLFPPPEQEKVKERFQVAGFRNEMRPDGAVPELMGTLRYAPPMAGSLWSEIVGDLQYVRGCLLVGGGNIALSDYRFGNTSVNDFDEVEFELLTDLAASTPMILYPWQVVEERIGTELVRPWPTDDAGERIDGPSIETPIVRSTGKDASAASLIFWFPTGLIRYSREGDARELQTSVKISQRASSEDAWQEVVTLTFRAEKAESFFRQHTWDLPYRARWQIQVTLLDNPPKNERYIKKLVWASLQTIRPENSIAYSEPVTKIAFRAKATAQFNGQIDTFNALCSRIMRDWDHTTGAWIERASSNPAAAFRLALQSEANARPSADDEIDLEALQDWHDFCRIKDLKFDHVFEEEDMSLRDALTVIAAAGRATPRRMGGKWTVVIDRPQTQIIDHISSRNADELSTTRSYFEPPHAFRVRFKDATDDFRDGERLVRNPDYEGPISVTEVLEMPGKTDPDEIAREATRRFFELKYRPDLHQAVQDHGVGTATRGDLIMFSNEILTDVQWSGRVRAVEGSLVVLDETVAMDTGQSYALRFLKITEPAPGDPPGAVVQSVLRSVVTMPGETSALSLAGTGDMPVVGDLAHFGPAEEDSFPVIIQSIEMGEEFRSIYRMVAHAPIIDELIDAYVPPPWTGRVGDAVEYVGPPPAPPEFISIRSSYDLLGGVALLALDERYISDGSGDPEARDISVRLRPGNGSNALLTSFQIEHRLAGPNAWTVETVPIAAGGATISGYLTGEDVEIRARSLAVGGTESAYSPTVSIIVGEDDPELPGLIDGQTLRAEDGLGHATITVAIAPGATTELQLYRVPAGDTLDVDIHATGAPVPATAGSTLSVVDGDATRQSIVANGQFSDASAWSAGTGWSIGTGHALGQPATSAASLSQDLTLNAGDVLRLAYTIEDYADGSVTPRLTGGTTVTGDTVSANGRHYIELTVAPGNTTFEFRKDTAFFGKLSAVTLYVRTSASAPQGTWDYYAEPRNQDAATAIAGPVSAEVA